MLVGYCEELGKSGGVFQQHKKVSTDLNHFVERNRKILFEYLQKADGKVKVGHQRVNWHKELGAGGDVSTFTSLCSVPVCASREGYCTWKTDCTPREMPLYSEGIPLYFKGSETVPQRKRHCTPREETLYPEGKNHALTY